ncbi:hypothetical protein HYPSUDRAFT_743132 [Hypholoma sublateritium FD-334 SS-4]|uniref:DUF3533 domain-containing protein n=1 Tax=Hypholoma sublateritium (strain FD-334 SS-4) TaxID=945553 RepID=A0A0D2L3I1_HYPSF|nr:hypothetical protein HYPSUDRAFT_743132 [Hypholoma sublateritium FD-334 SS-4]
MHTHPLTFPYYTKRPQAPHPISFGTRHKNMDKLSENENLSSEAPSTLSMAFIVPAAQSEAADNDARPFSQNVWGSGQQLARARTLYFKTVIPGVFLVTFIIFAIFSIFWGALWKVPAHPLDGWIVDFDGGEVGQAIMQGLTTLPESTIKWIVVPATQFPEGVTGLIHAVEDEQAWVAVAINEQSTQRLESSVSNPSALYDGTLAVSILGVEARNENAYRNFLAPAVQSYVTAVTHDFNVGFVSRLSSVDNLSSLLSISPQTVVSPVSHKFMNLLLFSQPVATAASFVGLIFLLIMSFLVVAVSNSARMTSGLARLLTLRSLLAFRLLSSFTTYFFLSLCYSLLNLAFKLDVYHTFGKSGFLVFWMGAWVYMLAVGLALESLIVLLKQFIAFFLITWIIVNVSINLFPLEVLPRFFHYGYGAPFYSFNKIIRTVVFGTKNDVGLHFGVLIVWVAISCTTLVVIQWNERRLEIRDMEQKIKSKN